MNDNQKAYTVLRRVLETAGQYKKKGEDILLTEEQAKPLLAQKFVEKKK